MTIEALDELIWGMFGIMLIPVPIIIIMWFLKKFLTGG